MTTYQCDVLIVGGGVLGAWVLERLLGAGYQSPILLETDLLGCRQTGHSDAFLHQGYTYYWKPGAALFIGAWNAWQPWLPPPVPPAAPPPAYHVYLKSSIHQATLQWRANLNVPLPPVQPNTQCPVVAAGVTHNAIETEERCAPGDWIVDRLVDGRRAHLQKVRQISRIVLAHDATLGRLRIQSVEVVMNDGTSAVFEPKTLLFCAGQTNQALLNPSIWGTPQGHTLPAAFRRNQTQNEIPLDMIVASGPAGTLPVFNGSVAGGSVQDKTNQLWNVRAFVVSRTDLGGNTVWIASGRIDRTDATTLKILNQMTGRDFRSMLVSFLSNLFLSTRPTRSWSGACIRLGSPHGSGHRTFCRAGRSRIWGSRACWCATPTGSPSPP